MNVDYSPTAVHKWDEESKSWWSRRSSLEQKLIILLAIIGLLSSGFLIYFFLTRTATPEIRSTPGCLLAASQIISHVDPTIDPCDDFFRFACGNFIKQTHGDVKAASKLGIEDLVERQVKEIIQEPIRDEDHALVKIQKQLFQACMNESAVEEESLDIFKETLKELKGWPVVVGYLWKARLFDWQDMIYELRKRGYYCSMILEVTLINDPGSPNQYIVYIDEPVVEPIEEEHKELYKRYMTDVAVLFGAERNLAAIEMEQVLDFMERLNKIAAKNNPWQAESGNETSYNPTEDLLSRRFTVEEFQEKHDEIDWLELINTILNPTANITSEDHAIFPNSEYVDDFFYLLRKTPRRTQANYIIWSVLQHIMPFMSKELKQLQANYTCSTDKSSPAKSRLEFCLNSSEESFLVSPADILYARKYLSHEKKAQVEEILENIRSELKTSLMEAAWADEKSKENIAEKVDGIRAVVGYEEDYFNDTIFDILEVDDTEDDDEDSSFFTMLLTRQKQLHDTWYSLLHVPVNESYIYGNTIFGLTDVLYLRDDNLLMVTAGILQGIFYNGDRPMYMNYGAIGSQIGQKLTKGFDNLGSRFDKDGNENDLWTNETRKAFEEQIQCFSQKAEYFGLQNPINEIILEGFLTSYVGLKVSYAAYKNWVQENEEEPQLPGVDYTPQQLFWISAMSPHCYKLNKEGTDYDMGQHVFKAGAPMSNNFNFADDFNCPADSRMNPSERCDVF